MQGIIKTKSFKIVSLLLVAAICVTAVLWNPLQAHAVEIGDVNSQGYSLLNSGNGTSTPVTSGSFGMFFTTKDNTDARFNANNLEWTYADSKWSPASKLLWANSSAEADVYAYYPYNADATDMEAIPWTVQADQSDGTDSSDILRYSGTAKYTAENAGLNVAFNHAGTKLVVDLRNFGTEIDASAASVTSVKLSGATLGGTLNLTDGAWTLPGDSTTVTMYYNDTAKTAECILPPQTIDALTVTVTLSDGSVYVFNAASAVTVNAGTQYTMDVQIGQDVINMGTISITDWNAVNGGALETN